MTKPWLQSQVEEACAKTYRTLSWSRGTVFDFRTLHGTTDAPIKARRRAFSTRWLGDDMVYCERAGETSPPLEDLGVTPGAPMPESMFPTLWQGTAAS